MTNDTNRTEEFCWMGEGEKEIRIHDLNLTYSEAFTWMFVSTVGIPNSAGAC